MTEVIMPKMGDGMEEGTLLEWLKKDGDRVKSGEVIGNIQTDKATLELEAPGAGTLTGFLIEPGATVPVGKPIAAILKDGEKLPIGWAADQPAPTAKPEAPKPEPAMQPQQTAEPAIGSYTAEPANGSRIKASPLARKVATEKGVDLSTIKGSGPGGRIIEKDVVTLQPSPKAAPVPLIAASAEDKEIKLGRLRQITAQRTAQSKQQVPHYYVTVEVDVEKIYALREMMEDDESGKISVNDFVVKACALSLRDMPVVNSAFQGQTLLQHGSVNVGIAIAIDEGLTVAVIKNADLLSLRQISERSKDLVQKAKANRLSMDELAGSTFSISNMGMLDIDNFLAIINQPNSAILSVSTARKKVVPNEDDEIEIRHRMNVACSFDHRVIDGAVGARFINVVRSYLENPTRLIS